MQDLTVERMKQLINKYYSQGDFRESLSFTQQDANTWCDCSACDSVKSTYGAQSATLIKFINPVARRVREWLETAWPGHKVNIAIFAYFKAESAPTKKTRRNEVGGKRGVVLRSVPNGELFLRF